MLVILLCLYIFCKQQQQSSTQDCSLHRQPVFTQDWLNFTTRCLLYLVLLYAKLECSYLYPLETSIGTSLLFVYYVHIACCCVHLHCVSLAMPFSFILMVFVFVTFVYCFNMKRFYTISTIIPLLDTCLALCCIRISHLGVHCVNENSR